MANYKGTILQFVDSNLGSRSNIVQPVHSEYRLHDFKMLLISGQYRQAYDYLQELAELPNVALQANENYQIIELLREIDKMPLAEKRKSLLFIPQDNLYFWQLSDIGRRRIPFAAPALSGIAMIDGLPPVEFNADLIYYGYRSYQLRDQQQPNFEEYIGRILDRARQAGYHQVIVLKKSGQLITKSFYIL